MESKYGDLLRSRVNAENDMDALLRMIPRIGIDVRALQSMMLQFICSMEEAAARTALFNVNPIDAIISRDVLQNIAAFNHCESQRRINKSFKNCYNRNHEMVKRIRPQIVEKYKHEFSPMVNHNERTNQIYIVHPAGQSLTTKASEYGKLVTSSTKLQDCISNARSGDKILIQDGSYVLRASQRRNPWSVSTVTIQNKHLQIIGIGDNVKIQFQGVRSLQGRIRSCKLSIEEGSHVLLSGLGIHFEGDDPRGDGFTVSHDSHLWVRDCIITSKRRIAQLFENGSLYILSSRLKAESGIMKSSLSKGEQKKISKFSAIDCIFNCNIGCAIRANYMHLRCIGNIFSDSIEFIGVESSGWFEGNLFKDGHSSSFHPCAQSVNKIL